MTADYDGAQPEIEYTKGIPHGIPFLQGRCIVIMFTNSKGISLYPLRDTIAQQPKRTPKAAVQLKIFEITYCSRNITIRIFLACNLDVTFIPIDLFFKYNPDIIIPDSGQPKPERDYCIIAQAVISREKLCKHPIRISRYPENYGNVVQQFAFNVARLPRDKQGRGNGGDYHDKPKGFPEHNPAQVFKQPENNVQVLGLAVAGRDGVKFLLGLVGVHGCGFKNLNVKEYNYLVV